MLTLEGTAYFSHSEEIGSLGQHFHKAPQDEQRRGCPSHPRMEPELSRSQFPKFPVFSENGKLVLFIFICFYFCRNISSCFVLFCFALFSAYVVSVGIKV